MANVEGIGWKEGTHKINFVNVLLMNIREKNNVLVIVKHTF